MALEKLTLNGVEVYQHNVRIHLNNAAIEAHRFGDLGM